MKILVTDDFNHFDSNKYDRAYLFNSRVEYENIISLPNLLESEQIYTKLYLNNFLNKYLVKLLNKYSTNNLNKDLNLFYGLFFEKNIFATNFFFNIYQCLILLKLKKKLISHSFEYHFSNETLNTFFDSKKRKKRFISELKMISKSFFSGIFYHFKNNLPKFFFKKFKFQNNKYLFIDHYSNFDQLTGQSKIWNNLFTHFKDIQFNEISVNSEFSSINDNSKISKIENYNNLKIFFSTLIEYFYIFFCNLTFIIFFKKKSSFDLLFRDFLILNFSGSSIIKTINYKKIFACFFTYNHFEKIFFTFENQLWEKIIVYTVKKISCSTVMYSYIHTPIRYWDLRFDPLIFKHPLLKKYLSDYICLSSQLCLQNYKIIPNSLLKQVEPLRYLNLNNIKKSSLNFDFPFDKFVIVGDIVKNSTLNLINLLDKYSDLNKKKILVYIKFHHLNIVNTNQFKNLKIIPINDITLYEDLLFLFPNYTTASIDLYYKNKIGLTFLDFYNFNLSPLLKLNYNNLFFYDLKTFQIALKNILNNEFKNHKQIFYFSDKLDLWKRILNDKN